MIEMRKKKRSRKLYYSVAEAAQLLKVSHGKLYRLIRSELLQAKRIGPRLLRIPAEDLDRFKFERDEFNSNYFSRKEASRRLRVTEATIDNWIWWGYLSAHKFATEPLGVLREDVFTIDPGAKAA